MMKIQDMTISQIRQKENSLARGVEKYIRDWEEETGLQVSSVSVGREVYCAHTVDGKPYAKFNKAVAEVRLKTDI